jgi:hypothetical protein
MGLLYGRAGRLTALFGGFRPGQGPGGSFLRDAMDAYSYDVHHQFVMECESGWDGVRTALGCL